jgi:hypothetical protein
MIRQEEDENKVICAGSIVISQSHGLVITAGENFRKVISVRKSYTRICEKEMNLLNTSKHKVMEY